MRRTSWHLSALMALRGIGSAAELSRQLESAGHKVTPTHTARLVKERPGKLDMELLDALLTVLDCAVGDLLGIAPLEATPGVTAAKQATTAAAPAPVAAGAGQEVRLPVTDPSPAPPAAEPVMEKMSNAADGGDNVTGQKPPARRQAIYLPPTPLF